MKAIWLRAFGPPSALELGSAPAPVGESVIDVAYANITFVETQVRAGRGPFPVELPMIPGNGVGGWLDGRGVVASLNGRGGYAEQAVPGELFEVPSDLALDAAVALLADGRTATLLTDAAALTTGDRVLVLAAAGGVGTLLVQLGARAGAAVVGAASTPAKRELVLSLGASSAIEYANLKRDSPSLEFDVVFDGVGGAVARDAFAALAPGGRMLSYGLASGEWAGIGEEEAAAREVRLVRAGRPERSHTERALSAGLAPVIGQRFPLDRAADAHAAIEARATTGKTLLVVQADKRELIRNRGLEPL